MLNGFTNVWPVPVEFAGHATVRVRSGFARQEHDPVVGPYTFGCRTFPTQTRVHGVLVLAPRRLGGGQVTSSTPESPTQVQSAENVFTFVIVVVGIQVVVTVVENVPE